MADGTSILSLVGTVIAIAVIYFWLKGRRGKQLAKGPALDQAAEWEQSVTLSVVTAERDDWKRRFEEQFRMIESIVLESQQSKKLYQTAIFEAAGAQNMLFQEIDSFARQYAQLAAEFERQTGKPAPRRTPVQSPILAQIRQTVEHETADLGSVAPAGPGKDQTLPAKMNETPGANPSSAGES